MKYLSNHPVNFFMSRATERAKSNKVLDIMRSLCCFLLVLGDEASCDTHVLICLLSAHQYPYMQLCKCNYEHATSLSLSVKLQEVSTPCQKIIRDEHL